MRLMSQNSFPIIPEFIFSSKDIKPIPMVDMPKDIYVSKKPEVNFHKTRTFKQVDTLFIGKFTYGYLLF